MEIYQNTSEYVGLTVFVGGSLTNADGPVIAKLYESDNNSLLDTTSLSPVSTGTYEYLIGLQYTGYDRKLKVVWEFTVNGQTASKTDIVEVVTPYVTPQEIKDAYPQHASKTFDQIKEVERLVRIKINNETGQSFGKWTGTYRIRGNDSTSLSLPRRLYNLSSLTVNGMDLLPYGIDLSENFYYINYNALGTYYDIKADVSIWSDSFFKRNYIYEITGDFGWDAVPSDINLAARMLVNDYLCKDIVWHQKGVTELSVNDTRMKFGGTKTGNKDVDDILDAYIFPNMVIV